MAYENQLKTSFQLSSFRTGQKEIIQSILNKKDVLAVLPTGGGKSLCYQFVAVWLDQLVVVISPLIALMKDQVRALKALDLPAGCLHAGQDEDEKREVFKGIQKGGAFVLYLSPERAYKEGFRRWVQNQKVALFAIDEAHCVSQWGHDFREEYAKLSELKLLRPDVPTLALTASATPLVLDDIALHLQLQKPERHIHGFYRPNLYYQVEVVDADEKMSFIDSAIEKTPTGRILIYCGTRRSTEEVAEDLKRKFSQVDYYHAGLPIGRRQAVQSAYASGESRILVATNAFGMGIDQPDVRLVIHHQLPANIDSLYQEMGRAGRDGKMSTCLLLYAKADKGLQNYFIVQSTAPQRIKDNRWKNLNALVAYAEGGECRHAEILAYYKDAQRIKTCGHCDSCDPKSQLRVERRLRQAPIVLRPGRKSKRKVQTTQDLTSDQQILFDQLRDWRKKKAQELDQPAFVVMSDKSLRDLVIKRPRTLTELHEVYGFGEVKVEILGPEIVRQIREIESEALTGQ